MPDEVESCPSETAADRISQFDLRKASKRINRIPACILRHHWRILWLGDENACTKKQPRHECLQEHLAHLEAYMMCFIMMMEASHAELTGFQSFLGFRLASITCGFYVSPHSPQPCVRLLVRVFLWSLSCRFCIAILYWAESVCACASLVSAIRPMFVHAHSRISLSLSVDRVFW